jgi:2-(3-amino-3-carboxypropyl)histidine synthase
MFDLETDRAVRWILDRGFKSVAIQLPEGLKARAVEISDAIRSGSGASVVISGDPCYGACDLLRGYKSHAEALVHFGHSPIPSMGADGDVLFIEARAAPDISSAV